MAVDEGGCSISSRRKSISISATNIIILKTDILVCPTKRYHSRMHYLICHVERSQTSPSNETLHFVQDDTS